MYKEFIKDWLLNNQPKVYSLIAQHYKKELMELKPTLFRKWLAVQLEISEDKINLSSLNSALARQKKTNTKEKRREEKHDPLAPKPVPPLKENIDGDFVFSKVDNYTTKNRTTEM